jgi:Bacterial PH domain
MFWVGLRRLLDPKVERHLIRSEGEVIIDEVRHHWVVYTVPFIELMIAILLLGVMLFGPLGSATVILVVVVALLGHSGWQAINQHRDRFVVTNMRVIRIRGVFSQVIATTPIMRILDVTVIKPISGRVFGYGHFVFESAAQEQGFREIRYVSRPDERDLTIQTVIQRSGLRASVKEDVEGADNGSGESSGPSVTAAPTAAQPPVSKVIFNSERTSWSDPFD